MKTLDQVEPRKPISQPAAGGFPIVINASGSYYLTGNITGASNTDGIRINVSGVAIDLNGFEMTGTLGFNYGIAAPAAISNVTIRNGVGSSSIRTSCSSQNLGVDEWMNS
jgi:hypothetical protein